MPNSFDIDKVRAHRLAEADAGFPLLRSCPNTAAISLCRFLDRIGQDQWGEFALQLSEFIEADLRTPGMSMDAQRRKLEEFSLAEAHLGPAFAPSPQPPRMDFALIPVKVVAGLMTDDSVGGLKGWAKMIGAPDLAFIPAKGHAASLEDMVPVAQKRLRKLIDGTLVTRLGLTARKVSSDTISYETGGQDGRMKIDVTFPRGSPGATDQFSYLFLRERPDGRRAAMQSYESIWRIPASWNYLTETNAEKSIAHFARLIAACDALV
jgi:hypothetical protein